MQALFGEIYNTRVLPSISIDDGFVSTAVKAHLQKFWIVLLHRSDAFDEQMPFCRHQNGIFEASRAICWPWNGAFGDHTAFRWPWSGVLGALEGLLALERRFGRLGRLC